MASNVILCRHLLLPVYLAALCQANSLAHFLIHRLDIFAAPMDPSIIQLSRQKTKDRNGVITHLDANLNKLSISMSYDGAIKYANTITCGISSTDTTQHRLFALEVNLEEEYPVEPTELTLAEVGELSRTYLRSKGIDLPKDQYDLYIVSPLQKNVAKALATHAKYRAIVTLPTCHEIFIPGTSISDPNSLRRMPHVFSGMKMETLAPIENKRGSSAAVNTGYIHSAAASLKRYLRGAYTTKSRVSICSTLRLQQRRGARQFC
jgi:hypothetical protein